jgi:hypothetical protein
MSAALWLLAVQGALGALDTLYYHEWRARLPAGVPGSRPELLLHSARDFLYSVLFGTLPWVAWHGAWAAVLALIIAAEIAITLADFVVEDAVRQPLGGVFPGERCMHTVMALIYGAALAYLVPVLLAWWHLPTQLSVEPAAVPHPLRLALSLMAVGVLVSGARDLYAALQLPRGHWPWPRSGPPPHGPSLPRPREES